MDVLLVEDNEDIRSQLWELLLEEKFDTEVARHGEEALRILRMQRPRIIVTDLYMPVMNGWRFVEQVKLDQRLRNVPVITMSSIIGTEPPMGTQFFMKPLELRKFFKALEIGTGRYRQSNRHLEVIAAE